MNQPKEVGRERFLGGYRCCGQETLQKQPLNSAEVDCLGKREQRTFPLESPAEPRLLPKAGSSWILHLARFRDQGVCSHSLSKSRIKSLTQQPCFDSVSGELHVRPPNLMGEKRTLGVMSHSGPQPQEAVTSKERSGQHPTLLSRKTGEMQWWLL